MSYKINVTALMLLADTQLNDEFKKEFKIDLMPVGIKEAVIAIKAEKAKEATYAAANEVVKLIEVSAQTKLKLVMDIRTARKAIEQAKQELDAIALAEKYASESSNYLPLYKAVGGSMTAAYVASANLDLFTVPNNRKQITITKRVVK